MVAAQGSEQGPVPVHHHEPVLLVRLQQLAQRRCVRPAQISTATQPLHRMPFDTRKDSIYVSVMWRATGWADIARHVIGRHLHEDTRA